MTWTHIGDNWNTRMDALGLTNAAEVLHIRALVQCNLNLTDGYILDRALPPLLWRFENPRELIKELVEVGLWERKGRGYQIDWTDQESAETVRRRQASNRERQRRFRARGEEMRRRRQAERDAETDKRLGISDNGVTNDSPIPSHPVPTLSDPKGGKEEGKGYEGARFARDRAGALPGSLTPSPVQGHSRLARELFCPDVFDKTRPYSIGIRFDDHVLDEHPELDGNADWVFEQFAKRMKALGYSGDVETESWRVGIQFPEITENYEPEDLVTRVYDDARKVLDGIEFGE